MSNDRSTSQRGTKNAEALTAARLHERLRGITFQGHTLHSSQQTTTHHADRGKYLRPLPNQTSKRGTKTESVPIGAVWAKHAIRKASSKDTTGDLTSWMQLMLTTARRNSIPGLLLESIGLVQHGDVLPASAAHDAANELLLTGCVPHCQLSTAVRAIWKRPGIEQGYAYILLFSSSPAAIAHMSPTNAATQRLAAALPVLSTGRPAATQ
jgi:hypothetical protein